MDREQSGIPISSHVEWFVSSIRTSSTAPFFFINSYLSFQQHTVAYNTWKSLRHRDHQQQQQHQKRRRKGSTPSPACLFTSPQCFLFPLHFPEWGHCWLRLAQGASCWLAGWAVSISINFLERKVCACASGIFLVF